MNDKDHIFITDFPSLVDHVTLVAQVTCSGPHLLSSACSRALLRRVTNVLCSPSWSNNSQVYIVAHKNKIKEKEFQYLVTECNLKLMKVVELTFKICEYCLDFTLHTYLHSSWTRVDNKYFQGKSCLFKNTWMGCVKFNLNIQSDSIVLGVKGSSAKLTVARLSAFHIKENLIEMFMEKKIRTITSSQMGDSTCYVLPSFKPALVHSISYDLPDGCPLNAEQMLAYWLDYHGMLIPTDTNIFVSVSFNFPGAPILTYPYYCIRKSYPIIKRGTQLNSIESFMVDINNIFQNKLSFFNIFFPIDSAKLTCSPHGQNSSGLVSIPLTSPVVDKLEDENYELDNNPDLISPLKDRFAVCMQSSNKPKSGQKQKIKPRFAPYTVRKANVPDKNQTSVSSTTTFTPLQSRDEAQSKEKYKKDTSILKTACHSNAANNDDNDFVVNEKLFKIRSQLPSKEKSHGSSSPFQFKSYSPSFNPSKCPNQEKSARKAPPKVATDEEIILLFKKGKLDKVNSHSLGMFLKAKGYKGVGKMKKHFLVLECTKYLNSSLASQNEP